MTIYLLKVRLFLLSRVVQYFFSLVIFYGDITLKVVEIFDFRKKFIKGMVDAFYVIQLPGVFFKNLIFWTYLEQDVIISKSFFCKDLSNRLLTFKFLNGLSYWHQIGLRWKILWKAHVFDDCVNNESALNQNFDWETNFFNIQCGVLLKKSFPYCIS